jgi:hypothetical protein
MFFIGEILIELMEVLEKHGLIGFTHIRNAKMRHDFKELRRSGWRSEAVKEYLAEKYFASVKTIDRVVYGKGK